MNKNQSVLLEMVGIGKSFPGVRALNHINFDIRAGEIHALCGENGAGKSTMMKLLSGIYTPDEGQILMDGKSVHISRPDVAQRLGIATIHQELSLVPELTVAENIFLGDYPQRLPGIMNWKRMKTEAEHVLSEMGFSMNVDEPAGKLGIAKQQIVEIAKALHRKAKIVILDEPTAPLANQDVERLIELVGKLKRENLGIVYITHRLPEVFWISDRVTVLKDGQHVSTRATEELTRDDLVKLMVGRELSNMRLGTVTNYDKKVMTVRNLSTPKLLGHIHFDLYEGEVLGLAGLVGSGRTELARAIFGADPFTGQVEVNGKPVHINSPKEAIKQGIALLPEDRKQQGLIMGMSALENMTVAGLDKFSTMGIMNKKQERADGNGLVQMLQVRVTGLSQETRTLSGGNQQKLIIARWLYNNANIWIFDEPTRGIDVGAKSEIYHLINQFAKDGGSVLIISSELTEVLMCDRILIMSRGKMVKEFLHRDATEESVIQNML